MSEQNELESATFGNGCFWCTEAVFQELKGVTNVISGYSGGHVNDPTYEQVCGKQTGHAEVLRIEYDASKISYDKLLEIFWTTHDPTTLNRQGNDSGPQYRSVIFYHNEEQKSKAEKYKEELDRNKVYDKSIVTAIEPLTNFFSAEDHHQNYYRQHGSEPYCYFVIKPKMEKFKKAFADALKK
jgi:peptide-methionine (S)-S-oxide reductase